ncbi:hypothetical protein CUR86_01685 [Salinicola acroporae]|uniref:Uncharacterized protein n=1 Tax=Salinicola acroporae TaxID=1541440 RepID=A0ABT6I0U8_9GAMM|nr:hypothetical protein [Salinicola acroporae]
MTVGENSVLFKLFEYLCAVRLLALVAARNGRLSHRVEDYVFAQRVEEILPQPSRASTSKSVFK